MNTCPSCGKEISLTSEFCRNCGFRLTKPKKPILVIISAVLLVIMGVLSISTFFGAKPQISLFLGIEIPIYLRFTISIIEIIMLFYCAFGLFFLKKRAKNICFGFMVYSIIDTILSNISSMTYITNTKGEPSIYGFVIVITLLAVIIKLFIIFSLIKNKSSFV